MQRTVVLLSLVAAAVPGAAGAAGPDLREIRLAAGRFDPQGDPLPSQFLPSRTAYPAGLRGGYLVQFERPITGADRHALEAAGARIGGYVPMLTLEVVMDEVARARVEELAGVRWVGPYQPSWKIAPALLAAADATRGPLRLRVSLFAGEPGEGLVELRGLGARLHSVQAARSFSVVDLELPAARLRSLLDLPRVRHVQVAPTRVLMNDRARHHAGLDLVADPTFASGFDPSLDGRDESSGFQVVYGHTDGGLWSEHPDFQTGIGNGWITWEPGADADDASGHGTHTAGILVGDGGSWSGVPELPPGSVAISMARWRGVQPEAALHHISTENAYTDREIFERHAEEGAHVLSNSWGYADCPSEFFCNTITDYEASAALWDEGVWDADDDEPGLQPVVAFFAGGNDGLEQLNGCGLLGSGDWISTPGTAKNVITVGATETDRNCGGSGEDDNPGDVFFLSSRGPVDPDGTGQGLFKPDLTAVGVFVLSTERDGSGGAASASGFDDPGYCSDSGSLYRYEGGSSMACPVAAGAAGVLIQDLVTHLGVAEPSPSLVKALLVNGAESLEPSGPCSYSFETESGFVSQGWGRVRAERSLYGPDGTPAQRNRDFLDEVSDDALATGESWQTTIQAAPGVPLRVTLVWTDHPAAPGVGSPLVVNDLDLEVEGPEGLYLGNNFDGVWSVESQVKGTADRYNVVENVYLEDPVGGAYTITVRAFQVSQDQEPDKPGVNQDFSLVWSTAAPQADCANGLDDDADGLADLEDPGCDGAFDASERSPLLACDDGADNDADGRIDHHPDPQQGDPGCRNPSWPMEDPQCSDGLNNDPKQDAALDFDGGAAAGLPPELQTAPDPECVDRPWKNREAVKRPSCGLGAELVLVLPALWAARRQRRARRVAPRARCR